MPRLILHLKPADASDNLKGWHLRLYRKIRELCENEGIACEIRERDKDIRVGTRLVKDRRFSDGNLHIIDDRSIQAEGVLNASVAYFWEYWHLDQIGTKAFSSIGQAQYDPSSVAPQRAEAFARNLRKKYSEQRRSKYSQPDEQCDLPSGAISIFFQGRHPITSGASHHSDIDILVAAQAVAGNRPIIVKPHPLSSDVSDRQMVEELAMHDNRIHQVDANVHDILSTSICTISNNSTVSLEGFMHGVPAVLCGVSDFHHLAQDGSDLDHLGEAVKQATETHHDYDNYLTWYFVKNCLHLKSGKLNEILWERFSEAGFPRKRF
ncbi:hypothetical protein PXK58_20960 [Phaeobacter gallaeciensis]|uniref:hypothetical protein n=1 Tax=Phaeobacter gallaeciensis TaxID=60890 RepID=UPI002380BCB6|nr:hypothetical protein [Phaeobacter gallaeciensis]MDE4276773.1 hypothetical protein [Phaeobacter gallaeciensis]MDE4301998.1 hypothetical protein [Phaeobacter gallaeciensis]MDE5187197.1 hypothetical protein [Phaeobacter gallaeciensis]